jgi:N4-(beta-N-acetylglucosaminyl)-L-asparaginase
MKRRGFIKKSSLLGVSIGIPSSFALDLNESKMNLKKFPVVIATWEVKNATNKAWNLLKNGSSSLDAVEQGCMIEEADVNNQSVGMGGLPDRDGNVTLDACIMNSNGDCGSVVYLKNITHAISIARKIMEETPHVMLAGVGAEEFAYSLGYKKEALLTDKSRFDWLDWKKNQNINQ